MKKSFINQIAGKNELEILTLAINQSSEGIALVDMEGNLQYLNNSFAEMHGYSADELVGKNLSIFHTPEQVPMVKAANLEIKEKGFFKGEIWHAKRDGTIFPTLMNNSLVKNDSGELAGMLGTIRDITKRKKMENALLKAHNELEIKVQKRTEELRKTSDQLHHLSQYLQSSIEKERAHIAREVHDDLGQLLTAVKMDLSWLGKKIHKNQKKLIAKTGSTITIVDQAIRTVKKIISTLRPGPLNDLGLVAAIEWQVEDFINRTGIQVKLSINPSEFKLQSDLSTTIFRIIQESLTNIIKHSKATKVKLAITKNERLIEIFISDNGVGIVGEQINDYKSYGIIGIKERVNSFNGKIEISSRPGQGTTLDIFIPTK
jgi:PAS domain S-box-containing protein